ncbi:MAG: precorrin-3B C(17)-methyltransferase [Deltaproteobacteria bacterium]|nr:precorrin-3B C(17)-methyltransferase [Deltaproteobacteria bacterium]
MDEKKDIRKGDGGRGKGQGEGGISVIGIGPGSEAHLTGRAREALAGSGCVVGYTRYVDLIKALIPGKEVYVSGMTFEAERCEKAIALARRGKRVAVVSSGDAGIYGMAGLVMQLAMNDGGAPLDIEVIPGVPAFVASAALLGAPLMHDFASISLSDLLTPWAKIEERVEAAAKADFVMILYNPRSSKRKDGLARALDIVAGYRRPQTPVGLVRNAARQGEEAVVTTIAGFAHYYEKVDMLSIVIIGNAETFASGGRMITPRGYKIT